MFKRLFFVCVLLSLLFSGCAPIAVLPIAPTATPVPSQTPIQMTDGIGTLVELPAPAARIVSLAPSNTEILFALGAGPQLVGRDELSNYPADAARITSIGSTYEKMNIEAIVMLRPDLVLAAETTTPEQIKTLKDLGLTVYRVNNPKNFDGLYENLATVGTLSGHTKEAAVLTHSLQARVGAVAGKVAGIGKPKVFYEMDATDPAKPWTAGPGSFVDMLITEAGGTNIGSALKSEWAQMSTEQLIMDDPDIILLGSAAYGITADAVKQRAGWHGIAAIRKDAVFPVDDTIVTRPGPRLVDALEMIAKILHPGLFP